MRALILSTLVAGLATVTAVQADASPANAVTAQPALDTSSTTMAPIMVAQGCGPAFHRDPYGYCRPNRYGYGFYGPRVYRPRYQGYGYGPRFF